MTPVPVLALVLVALGILFAASGAAMVHGRAWPDRTDPRAGRLFLAAGAVLLLVASQVR